MKSKIVQGCVAAGVFLLVYLAACSKNSNNGYGSGGGTPPPPKGSAVSIVNFSFSPSTLTVASGTTVTWTNNDTAPHTVTADDNSFTSVQLNKGDTFTHKFAAAGMVNYHCNVHPMMKASVTAQ